MLLRRVAPAWGLLLLLAHAATAWGGDLSVIPDISRYFDTWLWVKSEGQIATSDPETKGASRTLVLNPDLTYEFHQRRDTRDSLLCRGHYLFSEESGRGGEPTEYLDLEGWFEPYEHRMAADFAGRDTLLLAGEGCENCPEHTFIRGRTTSFQGTVRKGERYRHDLWDGLRLELDPVALGWRIVVRDTARANENLARLTPPLHGPNPTDIQGWHFRNKANTGPNQGDVNVPQRERWFIFGAQGRGALTIEDLVLTPPKPGDQAGIESMRFTVAIEEARRSAAAGRP